MTYLTVRTAIESEIVVITRELEKLQGLLGTLDGDSATNAVSATGKKRGRKSAADKQATSEADLAQALEFLEAAGKSGVKAIKLSYLLKGEGHQPPGKAALLESGKVKMTGKGGASTYVFTG